MSYILDALKKLERKRPQGSVPNLFTAHGSISREPKRYPPWIWLLVVVLLSSILVLLAWLRPWKPVSRGTPPGQVTARRRPGTPLVIVNSSPAPSETTSSVAQSADERSNPPRGPTAKEAAAPERETVKPVEPVKAPAVMPKPEPVEAVAPPSPKTAPVAVGTAPPPAGEGAAAESAQVPAPPREATPKEIQDLRISGHVFSEEPRLRLIIIDNKVLREGDLFGSDLKVEEITPKGASISYRGALFQVQGRGD